MTILWTMESVHRRLQKLVRTLLFLIPMINIGWLLASVALSWPDWWLLINYEQSPLTWFSSIQLFSIALTCGTLYILESRQSLTYFWALLTAAFLFFSFDERFQIHEKLRDHVFKPNDIGTNIPGVGAGDFLFLVIGAVGLVFSFFLIKNLKPNRSFLIPFFLALITSLIATLFDAQPINPMEIRGARIHQFWEEILETIGQMFFFVSFLVLIQTKLNYIYEKK